MPFVLDASVAASWALADEDHVMASLALACIRTDDALVPSLWWFEIRNILIVSERRGRLTEAATVSFLRSLSRLSIVIDRAPEDTTVLALARRHRLTVYDASYLELAMREALPLATVDRDLHAAAEAEGAAILGTR